MTTRQWTEDPTVTHIKQTLIFDYFFNFSRFSHFRRLFYLRFFSFFSFFLLAFFYYFIFCFCFFQVSLQGRSKLRSVATATKVLGVCKVNLATPKVAMFKNKEKTKVSVECGCGVFCGRDRCRFGSVWFGVGGCVGGAFFFVHWVVVLSFPSFGEGGGSSSSV